MLKKTTIIIFLLSKSTTFINSNDLSMLSGKVCSEGIGGGTELAAEMTTEPWRGRVLSLHVVINWRLPVGWMVAHQTSPIWPILQHLWLYFIWLNISLKYFTLLQLLVFIINMRPKGISWGTVSSTKVACIHRQKVFCLDMFKTRVLLDSYIITLQTPPMTSHLSILFPHFRFNFT